MEESTAEAGCCFEEMTIADGADPAKNQAKIFLSAPGEKIDKFHWISFSFHDKDNI